MSKIQFGLVIPADALAKANRALYLEQVKRLLDQVKSEYHGAWLIDHLQFEGQDVLEGWTTLTYLCGLYPQLQ
jgi:alkanesulfonate monooxygenase SsuD/methylene tetrahydromethanopterin reductase-like flavin-dependent oxidoreductase (luciferase family)